MYKRQALFEYYERDKRVDYRILPFGLSKSDSGVLVYCFADDLSHFGYDDCRYGVVYIYRAIQDVYFVQQQRRFDRKYRLFPLFTSAEKRRLGACRNDKSSVYGIVRYRINVDGGGIAYHVNS